LRYKEFTVLSIYKIKPAVKDYIWGGVRLKTEYGIETDKEIAAEAWVLSCHPDGLSYIDEGRKKGQTLESHIKSEGRELLGKMASGYEGFPILVKLIDAKRDLSIQVHPGDDYALEHEKQIGKTEFWYVLDSDPDAYIYYGFSKEITKEEFKRRIKDNTLVEVLNKIPVKKGDTFFIEPGTLHAIGKGTVLAEVQQNSNLTYRVYDFGRVGADGKPRTLHIDKALDVTRLFPPQNRRREGDIVADCRYFKVRHLFLREGDRDIKITVDNNSFRNLLITDGQGTIEASGEKKVFSKGDSFFIPAGTGDILISGAAEMLLSSPAC